MKIIKNGIKKLKITLCLLVIGCYYQNTAAQVSIGGGLAYGNKINAPGVHINAQLFIMESIAIVPGFTYYFPSTLRFVTGYKRKWYEGSVELNYYPKLEILKGKLKPYAVGGGNYSIISYPEVYNVDNKKSSFGINLGAGAQYDFGKSVIPFLQFKHTIGLDTYSQTQIAVGVRYQF